MASILGVFRTAVSKTVKFYAPRQPVVQQIRTAVTTETGAILEKPDQVRFGLIKTVLVVFPFLYAGATLSKNGAAFLEENDIFVPDDDDD